MPKGVEESDDNNHFVKVLREDIAASNSLYSSGSTPPFTCFSNRHYAWHTLVQDYSCHQLTYESDRLYTLASII
jgi:hypothetical protein